MTIDAILARRGIPLAGFFSPPPTAVFHVEQFLLRSALPGGFLPCPGKFTRIMDS